MKKLKEISPLALLAAVFMLCLMSFALVELFPSWFYRTMDIASYLVFHNIAEFFSVMVSLSIFSVGWFTFDQSRNRHALFLGCAFLAIGLMDFMHTLGYAGEPAFITPNSPLKSTQFWIAARMYSALVFLVSGYVKPGSSGRLLSKYFLLASAVVVSGVVFVGVTYFPSHLPATIIEGKGVTPFKRYSEYLIILLFALSIPAYWRRYANTGKGQFLCYMAAFIICIFSELAFSGYKSVFDTNNVLGHFYKIIAFALIYQGIFIAAVKLPYQEVVAKSEELRTESDERKKAEEQLAKLNEELEQRVCERTNLLQRKTEELERANERLKEVDRLKSTFIASMSHELRTPLNAVIGFSSILLYEWLGPANAEQKQNLASILSSGRHLLNMINDVLDVTQIESGTVTPVIEEFDLYDLLTEAENEVTAAIREKGLELRSEPLRQRMRTDRQRLLQCVLNILSNAAKFTDNGGVTVEARIVSCSGETPEEEMVEIAVTDTGIGIGEEDQSRIFQPFYRIAIPQRAIVPGTGIGLFLTRKIATEILKGALLVSSEQGKGSRFSLRIPVRLP